MTLIKKPHFCLAWLLAGLLCAATAAAWDNDDCIACHRKGSTASRLTMDVARFDASVHGDNAGCMDCHSLIEDESHMRKPGSGVVDCGQCHVQENLHGIAGERENRPRCADCHTRHDILAVDHPAATVHPANLPATCGRCHPAQSGRDDYLSWLPSIKVKTHPKADLTGSYGEDNCLGCHQGQAAHGESDPINEAACYRCHLTPDGQKALLGFIHPTADRTAQPGVFVVAVVYQLVVLACIIGGLILFIRKFSGIRRP